jgi:hypothetical protein
MSTEIDNRGGNGPLVPDYFRRFKFKFNFQNTTTGQTSGGEGEVRAVNYASALVKIVALFTDQPGRMLALQFEDTTNQRAITPA